MDVPENTPSACRFIVTADGDLHADDTPQNRRIARRVRACVNACAGLTTEELERGIIADMRQVIANIAPLLRDKCGELERRIGDQDEPRDAVA